MSNITQKTYTLDCFNLSQIADSGQCFTMLPLHTDTEEMAYSLISCGRYARISQKGREVTLICSDTDIDFWENYMDLHTDYSAFIHSVSPDDSYLSSAADYGQGIRILRQDVWEMIITFIISQQKTIPKIREAIFLLSEKYGTPCTDFDGHTFYAFPTPQQLQAADENALRALKLGYRAKYIAKTSQDAAAGILDLEALKVMDYSHAMSYLTQFYGIGEKVANCICLFGLHHIDAFPVDTWIQKILLREYWNDAYTQLPKSKLYSTIIHDHFACYEGCAGVMQQYIFFYERTLKQKLK